MNEAVLTDRAPSVLFITRKWYPAVGGMETYSVRLAEALEAFAGVEVLALPGRVNGAPPTMLALFSFMARACLQLLSQRRPAAVVHLGDMVLWPLGLAAMARSRTTRTVLSAHGTDVAFHRRGGLKGSAYAAYLRLGATLLGKAKVIANSAATKDITAETGWKSIEVIALATDIAGPAPTGGHDGSLLFAGRLVERKGCAWFIRNVLPLLPERICLKVAGTKWDEDESRALENPRVEFLGSLHGEALIDAYRQALCVVVPNIELKSGEFEGFGLVATEAAAAGGVVLAARTGGLVQAVDEGTTGILVAPGDPVAWAEAVGEVAAWDIARRRDFLARSMSRCREHYSWRRVAEATYRAYGMPAE
jgi:glycosyltransferase involved in cell wall biosynthesis